jgi:dCTP diphosphatase
VLLYLVRLADKLNIDLLAAATEKIQVNAAKYPVEKARGSSKKYTEL